MDYKLVTLKALMYQSKSMMLIDSFFQKIEMIIGNKKPEDVFDENARVPMSYKDVPANCSRYNALVFFNGLKYAEVAKDEFMERTKERIVMINLKKFYEFYKPHINDIRQRLSNLEKSGNLYGRTYIRKIEVEDTLPPEIKIFPESPDTTEN